MNNIINDLIISIIMIKIILEFKIRIIIENHLNIKNDRGGILDIFINKSIKVKLGWGIIIEYE